MPNWNTKRGERIMRFPCIVSPVVNSLHSQNDRFAAQIDFLLRAMRYGGQGGGALPAYMPFTVLLLFLSFAVRGLRLVHVADETGLKIVRL